MKDKIVKKNKTKFDRISLKLGVIGNLIMICTFAFGLPIMNSLNHKNETLVKEIIKENKAIDNVQLQSDDANLN